MLKGAILCWTLVVAANDLSQVKEVGPVKVTTRLSPADPVIGDEIHLEIRVEAQSHVEVLMPEFGEVLDRYTILDFVPGREIHDDRRSVFTQRYTLQPPSSGEQLIPPILVEFVDNRPGQTPAPDGLDAYEIVTDRMDFKVRSVIPDDAKKELMPPLGELELARESRSATWVWGVAAVLLAAILAGCGVGAWRRWQRRVSRRNAYEVARQHLDQLLAQPPPTNEQEVDRFFVVISGIVRRYLEDRFELRAPELTTEEFLELAGSASDLSREHQSLLRDFLRHADLVKFAKVTVSPEEISRSADIAIRFLEETREDAPWIDEPDTPDTPDTPNTPAAGPRPTAPSGEERAGV